MGGRQRRANEERKKLGLQELQNGTSKRVLSKSAAALACGNQKTPPVCNKGDMIVTGGSRERTVRSVLCAFLQGQRSVYTGLEKDGLCKSRKKGWEQGVIID